jgi:hypothetical protein
VIEFAGGHLKNKRLKKTNLTRPMNGLIKQDSFRKIGRADLYFLIKPTNSVKRTKKSNRRATCSIEKATGAPFAPRYSAASWIADNEIFYSEKKKRSH